MAPGEGKAEVRTRQGTRFPPRSLGVFLSHWMCQWVVMDFSESPKRLLLTAEEAEHLAVMLLKVACSIKKQRPIWDQVGLAPFSAAWLEHRAMRALFARE